MLGSNWTLRLLVPTIWTVFDLGVWKSEHGHLNRFSRPPVVVGSKNVFGGGIYSTAGSRFMRMVGKSRVRVEEVQVAPIKEWFRAKDGKRHRKFAPPFQPTSLTQPLHLGGNSLCYMIQIAHVMGCDPIWAMGFTLKNGGGYFFGPRNPVTRNPSFYDLEGERALEWLRWYEANYQNRVRLLPGWDGPVYSVFRTEAPHEAAGHLPGFEDGPSTRERDAVPHGQVGSQAT